MTEETVTQRLPEAIEQFVLNWGDMGGQWGVNRSVAQIHALLYLSERPMAAEDIAEALGMARSNVSNSIRELITWKLIRRVPVLGDRRDNYEAETDLWQIMMRVAKGRKEREIDPAIAALDHVVNTAADDPHVSKVALSRLREMQSFIVTINGWYDQMITVPPSKIMALMKLGSRIVNLLNLVPKRGTKKDKAA
jgi:DNA-binding transcriptional regulator GbsR (MarR family)